MNLFGLAFDPFQSFGAVPKATVGQELTNSLSTDFNDVPHVEDLMILSTGISDRALLDEEIAVLFDFHSLNSLKRMLVAEYLIQSKRVEDHYAKARPA